MLKKILLGLLVVILIFLVVVWFQPAEYKVTRSATVAAPPATVFPLVNEFKKWEAWSPWEKRDPAMKRTFEGPAAGVGSKYGWVGNSDVGEGSMTITESKPNEQILINLQFIKPFESSCLTEFAFKPEGAGTTVTWTMSGKKNFLSKAICMFMDMDKMIGTDFEKGFTSLKTVAEAEAKK
jgi:uncharacterized protein YndB with AHSA1/START domain